MTTQNPTNHAVSTFPTVCARTAGDKETRERMEIMHASHSQNASLPVSSLPCVTDSYPRTDGAIREVWLCAILPGWPKDPPHTDKQSIKYTLDLMGEKKTLVYESNIVRPYRFTNSWRDSEGLLPPIRTNTSIQ